MTAVLVASFLLSDSRVAGDSLLSLVLFDLRLNPQQRSTIINNIRRTIEIVVKPIFHALLNRF